MKHVTHMKAEQLSVQQRLCRLEIAGSSCANSRAVLSYETTAIYDAAYDVPARVHHLCCCRMPRHSLLRQHLTGG